MLRRAGDLRADFGAGERVGLSRGIALVTLGSGVPRMLLGVGGGMDMTEGDTPTSSRLRLEDPD